MLGAVGKHTNNGVEVVVVAAVLDRLVALLARNVLTISLEGNNNVSLSEGHLEGVSTGISVQDGGLVSNLDSDLSR